jgi:diguanylate cyclase (GGDEF)-like protein
MPSSNRPKTSGPSEHAKEGRASHAEGSEPEIVQEHPDDAPAGWAPVQEKLAAASGLSVLLVDGRQPPALVASNNNSICRAFQSSLEYVGLCDPYCGDAHRRALTAGAEVRYKCHAGLQCFTMPVRIGGEQNLAAIGGRAFVSGADYRSLVERFRAGELNDLLDSDPFKNVIFAESNRLDQLSERLQKAARSHGQSADTFVVAQADPSAELETESTDQTPDDIEVIVITASDAVVEETNDSSPLDESPWDAADSGMFVIGFDPERQAELKHLRQRVHDSNLNEYLERLSARIDLPDPGETYKAIIAVVRELLKAERASVMTFDESANEIVLKASDGLARGEGEVTKINVGEGIAGEVFKLGKALVTDNLETAGFTLAPAERNYQTKSFLSFPIITRHGLKLGVLNVADKVDGGKFEDVDLGMLEVIAPRIAAAVQRAVLQEHSYTDPLTGLLNRRYLKQRLTEELNRSQRYRYPMSCLMVDIDDFKHYNDHNGHPAGDEALQTTAQTLKAALRAADVAFRYGGEEFCVLLPQTNLADAGVIAERMRQLVTQTIYTHGQSQPLGIVSVSIGISTFGNDIDNADKIIAAADRALYRAKARGKNRIEFCLDESAP